MLAALFCVSAAVGDDATNRFLKALSTASVGETRLGTLRETQDFGTFWLVPNVEPFFDAQKSFIHLAMDAPQAVPINEGRIDPLISFDPFSPIASPLRNLKLWMRERLSVKTDLYNCTVAQQASSSIAGQVRGAVSNRFSYRIDWKAWEIAGVGLGSITAQFRANNNWSAQNVDLSAAVGSNIVFVDSAENSSDVFLTRLFAQQGFCDDRILIGAGKILPNDTTAVNFFADDETSQFLASCFDGGDAMPIGWNSYLPGAFAQFIPVDGVYVNTLLTSPLGELNSGGGFGTVGDGFYLVGAEAGVVAALGADTDLIGRYSIFVCNTNAGTDTVSTNNKQYGNAMALIAQQFIDRDLGVWISYQLSDANISPATQETTFGGSLENAFGRHGDGVGLGLSWTDSSTTGDRQQKTIETYYRLRLTGSLELTADLQLIDDPSNPQAKGGATWVFGLRSKIKF
ncbi:MAG: hypothetical protein EXS12_05485 [Phycisphaerales bacterium]|nr:hypothetical protein [Phycisphaerales bacterium]